MRLRTLGHAPARPRLTAMLVRRPVGARQVHTGRARLRFALLATVALGILAALPLNAMIAQAATGPVTVSLSFDDTVANQYTLGYQRALQPHGTRATFFVNSGIVGTGASKLTWAQLQDLYAHGQEVG